MKDSKDHYTPDFPGMGAAKRGRPRKPDALTGAERARRHRERSTGVRLAATLTEAEAAALAGFLALQDAHGDALQAVRKLREALAAKGYEGLDLPAPGV